MAQNRRFSIIVALTNGVVNLLNPPAAPGTGVGLTFPAMYLLIDYVRVLNKTSSSHSFSFYIGATGASAAGTEFIGKDTVVEANKAYEWAGRRRLDAADFLTGVADANTSLVVEIEGELGCAG
jgi:hypothetical protein